MKGETFVMNHRRAATRTAVLFAILLLPGIITACSNKGGASGNSKGPVVAVVNGEKITEPEVDRLVKIIQERGFIPPDSVAKGTTLDMKQRNYAIDQLVERSLILADAKKRGVTVDTTEVNKTLAQYKQQLAAADSTVTPEAEAEMRRDLSDYLLINKYFQTTVVDQITITEQEMRDFMTKNPEAFAPHEQVSASHILIMVPQGASDMARADSLRKAKEILARVKKGEDFAGLARKYSQDTQSGMNGGQMPPFGRGQMVKPFEDAAFALPPGQISDLVETQFGYHIIKVQEHGMTPAVTFEQARPQLEQAFRQQKANPAVEQRIKDLRAAAKIEIKDKEKKTG
jgi:peptidyl-prolyl cis-trans isomerase C